MFLTGMGTALGTFFQITTMIISIPSVVLVTSLMLSLWGGSIRFTTPMLFALAFLPMFGIGGLTGLPLGLAASDVVAARHVVCRRSLSLSRRARNALRDLRRHLSLVPEGHRADAASRARAHAFLGIVHRDDGDLPADVHARTARRQPPALRRRPAVRARAGHACRSTST